MSKQQLTIEHLAPYLPYGVKCWVKDYTEIGKQPINNAYTLNAVYSDGSCVFYDLVESSQGFKEVKLILRPLSDLCQKIQVEGEETTWLEHLLNKNPRYFNYLTYKPMFNNYWEFESLVKNHFDVFGLIDQNLAINLNEVK